MKMYFLDGRFQDVNLEITNICNFDCWFCPRGAMTRSQGKMGFEDFKKLIAGLKKAEFVKNIKFAGIGEPTLHPDLIKMIRYIKDNTGFKIHLTTNASMFKNDGFVKELLETNVEKITASLRISKFESNKNCVPSNLSQKKYMDSIVRFVEQRYALRSKTTVEIAFFKSSYYCRYIIGKRNEEYIDNDKLNELIKRISKIVNVNIRSYEQFTDNIRSKMNYYCEIPITEGLIFRFDALNSWTTVVDRHRSKKTCYPSGFGACMGLLDHFAIYWNGDVSTCCLDFDAKNKLGNFFENDILEILASPRAVALSDKLRKRVMPTETCRICRGGKSRLEKYANIIGTIVQIK